MTCLEIIEENPTIVIDEKETLLLIEETISIIEESAQGAPGVNLWGTIDGDIADQADLQDALNEKIPLTQKAAANGVATLDASTKIPIAQIPDAIMGALNYQGTWNATTNSPSLASSAGTKGHFYVVSVAGSTNLNGTTDWQVGDYAVYNGTIWQKIDNTDAVTSVHGRTGAVVAATGDYSFSQISGTAAATQGGTGLTTYAQGDLIYASAANTPARLAKNTSASRYLSNTGTNNNPAWAQVNLANGVTGNLPVSRLNSGISAYYGQYWDGSGQWLPLPSGGGGTLYDVLNAGNDTYGQSINISGGGALSISCGGFFYGNGMYVCASGSQWALDYSTIYNQYGSIYTSYICAEYTSFLCCNADVSYANTFIAWTRFNCGGYDGIDGTFYIGGYTFELHGGLITGLY